METDAKTASLNGLQRAHGLPGIHGRHLRETRPDPGNSVTPTGAAHRTNADQLQDQTKIMGYTTTFDGSFTVTPPLAAADVEFLVRFAGSRRMKRNIEGHGIDGEWYAPDDGDYGQSGKTVVDSNTPPSTQPGLWCHWVPSGDGSRLEWDEGENFYAYAEWLQYLITEYFTPRGHKVTGTVKYEGEDPDDFGRIISDGATVEVKMGQRVW